MKFFLLLTLTLNMAWAHEKNVPTRADQKAWAEFKLRRSHPWPFPLLSIGHNMQSYQNYGAGGPYWHDGLDIRSVPDQPIYAAAGGKVVNIENYVPGDRLYWEVAILDEDGFVWKYHHVDRQSIAVKLGEEVESGTLLGKVVRWPVTTFGETYHHLHLLVVGADGKYINPFLLMEPLADTVPPVIHNIGLSKNHRPHSAKEVKGEHALYVEVSDLTLHEKFLLPPHKLSYRLNGGSENLVWEFVHLPSGTNDTKYITDFYLNGTCGNYRCRQFFINLNFTPERPRGGWSLPAGEHEIEVMAEDVAGNKTSKTFQWTVL